MAKYPRDNEEDELIFEDADTKPESNNEQTTFDFLLMLVKNILLKFKKQLFPFVYKVVDHLLAQNSLSTSSPLLMSMYEIVVLIPQIYNEEEIDLTQIFGLLEKSFTIGDYGMFSRLIRYYHFAFPSEMLAKSFNILTQIMGKN